MRWPRGRTYMWVHAARSCEWEVGTEWEEKSCFSEAINAEAHWKAVTLPRLGFVCCTCTNVARLAMVEEEGCYAPLPLSEQNELIIINF